MPSYYHVDQHNLCTAQHSNLHDDGLFDRDKENKGMLNQLNNGINNCSKSPSCKSSKKKEEEDIYRNHSHSHVHSHCQNRDVVHASDKTPIVRPISKPPSVLLAPKEEHYFTSGFVHCCVIRDAHPTNTRYRFVFQTAHIHGGSEESNTAMIAEKQQHNMTSNYHIFDTTRLPSHHANLKLNKKSGNYIGKLRKGTSSSSNSVGKRGKDKSSYSLFDARSDKEEIAAVVYDKHSLLKQWKDGILPRKFTCVIPHVDSEGRTERLPPYLVNRMVESIERNISTGLQRFESKDPIFEKDQYRLNFNGRVSFPSVKNMQIVDGNGDIFAQYGKVGENRFHLDYRYPLNALQAFGFALTAMDL